MREQLDELVAARDQTEMVVQVIAGIGSDWDLDVTLHRIATDDAVLGVIAVARNPRQPPFGSDYLELLTSSSRLKPEDSNSGCAAVSPEHGHRGRGITLMRALMHDIAIQPEPAGTTVQLSARIT